MKLLAAKDRPVSSWKNGQGTTSPLAIFPSDAGMEDFGWRVSIAQIGKSGPFSQFDNVDRHLAVLDGVLVLHVGSRPPAHLSPRSEPIFFPGDVPCRAEIPNGAPAQDLNVLTRRGQFHSRIVVRTGQGPIEVQSAACATVLVTLGDLEVRAEGSTIQLNRLDAVQIAGATRHQRLWCSGKGGNELCLYVIQIFGTPPADA